MTFHKPTIIINRLVVKKGGKTAYDENFHQGLNILRGANGGGKTSVIQLLVYSLGYDVPNWKDEAASCTEVFCEALFNREFITLRRAVERQGKQGMDIFFGSLEDAFRSGSSGWARYPYRVYENKESFSQQIFKLLDIPEARVDGKDNLTMHQWLRIIYSDQSNAGYQIFNPAAFDTAFKRESIGNYVLGVYDDDLQNAKIELAAANKDIDKIIDKLKAINSVLGKTSFGKDLVSIERQKEAILYGIADVNQNIARIRENQTYEFKAERNASKEVVDENLKIKAALAQIGTEIEAGELEILDLEDFLGEMKDKLRSLSDSHKLKQRIPPISFSVCPSCFTKIHKNVSFGCSLCGADITDGQVETNLLRMRNELSIQIAESERVLNRRKQKALELRSTQTSLLRELRASVSKVNATISALNSGLESELYEQYKKIGEYGQEMAHLDQVAELNAELESLRTRRDELQIRINRLREFVELSETTSIRRQSETRKNISKICSEILRRDISAETIFKVADSVEFDFAADRLQVNGKAAFSESSTYFLSNTFHVAMLLTALSQPYMRFPRLLVLDGIENGGMEDVRSQNFQWTVAEYSERHKDVDHQIIIATKSIHPDLDHERYTVGEKYSESNKSLDV